MPTPTTHIGLTYAGVPLLLPDPDGVVQAWIDKWLPLSDLQNLTVWQKSPWRTWNVPTPNYPAPLHVKLNTWYSPVGASRWAFGLFLIGNSQLNQILQNLSAASSAELIFTHADDTGTGTTIKNTAYMLPVRPVSSSTSGYDYLGEGVGGLYLLPLVDARYYWQFLGSGCYTVSTSGVYSSQVSWQQLMQALASQLGMQIEIGSVNAAYGKPDPVNWNAGGCANPAVGLDAAAWCVGQRITKTLNANSWKSVGFNESRGTVEENLRGPNSTGTFLAGALQFGTLGGQFLNLKSLVPQAVDVSFRKWTNGITVDPPQYYVKRFYASDLFLNSTPGVVQILQTTAYASYNSIYDANPANKTNCDALAEQLAKDFYAQFGWVQDSIYHGLVPWRETGFDNYIEYSIGSQNPKTGEYECKTRVHTVPHNLGVQTFLHWLEDTKDWPQVIEGKLDGPLSPYGTATLSVRDESGADSTLNVVVTDKIGWDAKPGAWCVAEKLNNQWRPIAISCDASPLT
jgi:hypothetical protein